jgi:hypothetical protein
LFSRWLKIEPIKWNRTGNDAEPDAEAEIDENMILEEASEASKQNVATSVGLLLVVILVMVTCNVLHLGNSESLAVGQAHVLHVAELVVDRSRLFRCAKLT